MFSIHTELLWRKNSKLIYGITIVKQFKVILAGVCYSLLTTPSVLAKIVTVPLLESALTEFPIIETQFIMAIGDPLHNRN